MGVFGVVVAVEASLYAVAVRKPETKALEGSLVFVLALATRGRMFRILKFPI